jgi:LytR cell envelope-related transcriptional attenuator
VIKMRSIAFAFSVHHFITSVGADAGFAAIVGLAILVLLFFAQARETSTLREQAFESAQRVQQLEARLAQLLARPEATGPQPTIPPAPAPPGFARSLANRPPSAIPAAPGVTGAPGGAVATPAGLSPAGVAAAGAAMAGATAAGATVAGATAAGPGGAGTMAQPPVPVAPAGVAAPALTAATKLIPTPVIAPTPESPPAPPPVVAPVAAGQAAAATAAGATAVADPPIDATGVGSLPPATAAANGLGRAAVPAPVGVGGGPYNAEADPGGPPDALGPPPPRIRIRPASRQPANRRSTIAPSTFAPQRTRAPIGVRFLVAGIGVLAVAGVVAALLILTSSNSTHVPTHTTARSGAASAAHQHNTGPAPFNPSSVTVAVLNGTSISGLAKRIATKLGADGYKQGAVTDGANQTQTATVVAYMPGARKDALEVASALKLGSASVQAIDSSTRAIACPSTSCTANVVVTVGQDLASTT